VVERARRARELGCGGVICSGHEAAAVREACGAGLEIITPGIRPAGTDAGDQARVMTPSAAVAAGADRIVVGRPIRDATDPAQAAAAIVASLT
ncbi:MAG: orotidine 5'-phosphate decarboxylase, partial [Myxococcales bacterium]|nr:orotidine 5'-phosphate decarboxylase [Myxococcales bacterium]